MSDYEIQRERVVEREVPVTERVVERQVPVGRRTVVERRSGGVGYGMGANPVCLVIVAAVVILLLLLLLGAFTWKLCRDLERHRHAARVAAMTEPPVAPNEGSVVEPASTVAGTVPGGARRRRFADTLVGLVVLWILRRAGSRRARARR